MYYYNSISAVLFLGYSEITSYIPNYGSLLSGAMTSVERIALILSIQGIQALAGFY